MSMQMTTLRLTEKLAQRLTAEQDLAGELVDAPERFGVDDADVNGFNYLALSRIRTDRPWLTRALDQEAATQVGDDFGYGPATLFNPKEVAQIANGLAAEVEEAQEELSEEMTDELSDFAQFFDGAARTKKAVLIVVS